MRDLALSERKALFLRRASDGVFLLILILGLIGSALGLKPEREEVERLEKQAELASAEVDDLKAEVTQLGNHLHLLMNDREFMEWNLRRYSPPMGKPGETLIVVPEERQEVYEREAP